MGKIRRSKYHAKPVTVDGQHFDSRKESKRYQELCLLEKEGKIQNLQKQVKYMLIPSQFGMVDGKRKCLERSVHYIADFVYQEDGQLVVEDSKGFRTKEYILKRKLMLQVYGIRIKET